ncbi:MAG: 2-C-methyl-D-erythritol 4-phosphate cytidylyltransferase [Gammaproteobacteria bacterium]|nr:2-C-methyl-D-erythritol 4-phosphate cytidylyltransferase [Gammaproteobacteria bacterium]
MIGVIPAAGIGQRMEAEIPKQYLVVAGKTLLDHSIGALFNDPRIKQVWVALHADDQWWQHSLYANDSRVRITQGGPTRADSVVAVLSALTQQHVAVDMFVVVHDAARPGLQASALARVLDAASNEPQRGALLALPVRDTVKLAHGQDSSHVARTVDREQLWLAQTPQVFQLGQLLTAISHAQASDIVVTDESSAMEAMGVSPVLVQGSRAGFKVTDPEDLALAAYYLRPEA